MHILSLIALQFIANSLAIKLADFLLLGVSFTGTLLDLARAAAILTLLNLLLKPAAKLFLGPFILLSFGLLALLLNAFLLWLTTLWAPEFVISTYFDLALTTLLFTLVNFVVWLAAKTR